MDDAFKDGGYPVYWSQDGFGLRMDICKESRKSRPARKPSQRSAAEIDLPDKIRSALSSRGSHPSEWDPITHESELRGLRAGEHVLIYRQTRKDWEPVRELIYGIRASETVIALRRRHIPKRSRFVGDSGAIEAEQRAHHETISKFFFHNQSPQYLPEPPPQRDPIVRIDYPSNGAMLRLEEVRTKPIYADYHCKTGDTLKSIATRFTGRPDCKAVMDSDRRYALMENDLEPERRVSIRIGKRMTVRGYACYAPQITLQHEGPTSASQTLGGRAECGLNWEADIPIEPGSYNLVARVPGAQHGIRFAILPADDHWLFLSALDADDTPAGGYPYRATLADGSLRTGRLDLQGEAYLDKLPPGEVEVSLGHDSETQDPEALREEIRSIFDEIIEKEKAEAAGIEARLQEESPFGKLAEYDLAMDRGVVKALRGILSNLNETAELATPITHLRNYLQTAWKVWRYSDEKQHSKRFVELYSEAEVGELVDVLGFDPRSIRPERIAEAKALLNFLWDDAPSREMLTDFAKDYIAAQHSLELVEEVADFVTNLAIDLALTALTLGAGGALAAGSKLQRLSGPLKRLGRMLKDLGKILKRRAGRKEATSATNKQVVLRLEKPENVESGGAVSSATMRGSINAPNKVNEIARLSKSLEFRKRALELSLDPDRGQLLVREGIGAARFEQATGRTVVRSTDGATDFIDPKIGPFDLKGPLRANDGSPIDITPKRIEGLGNSVIKEANNSTASKAVVVDTLGLNKEQISTLKIQIQSGLQTNKPIIYIE